MILRALLALALPAIAGAQMSRTDSATFADLRADGAGGFHTCGLTGAGAVYCWGDNSLGQLGRGTDRSRADWYFGFAHATPQPVAGSLVFASIAATWSATCGVAIGGASHCWGENGARNLGGETQQSCRIRYVDPFDNEAESDVPCSTTPLQVMTGGFVSALAVDQHGVCALLTTSELQCWGRTLPGPSTIPGARVSTVWSSGDAVCGLKANDTVSCWSAYPPFREVRPLGDKQLVDLNTSGRHTCGLERGPVSAAYCWGTNYNGEIGDGTTTHRELPVAVVWPFGAGAVMNKSP